jgi:hypothetical protein
MGAQLTVPKMAAGAPLTGRAMAEFVKQIGVAMMGEHPVLSPKTMMEGVKDALVQIVVKDVVAGAARQMEAMKGTAGAMPLAEEKFEAAYGPIEVRATAAFNKDVIQHGAPDAFVAKGRGDVAKQLAGLKKNLRAHNSTLLEAAKAKAEKLKREEAEKKAKAKAAEDARRLAAEQRKRQEVEAKAAADREAAAAAAAERLRAEQAAHSRLIQEHVHLAKCTPTIVLATSAKSLWFSSGETEDFIRKMTPDQQRKVSAELGSLPSQILRDNNNFEDPGVYSGAPASATHFFTADARRQGSKVLADYEYAGNGHNWYG